VGEGCTLAIRRSVGAEVLARRVDDGVRMPTPFPGRDKTRKMAG
jgi:hypothetical protein